MIMSGFARRALPAILLAGLAVSAVILLPHGLLSLNTLRDNRNVLTGLVQAHSLATAAAFVLLYVGVVALSLPGAAVLTISGGFLFGTALGAGLSVGGATLGAAILFWVARGAAGNALRRKAGPFLSRMAEGFERDAFNYMLSLRLVPVFPFWAVNLAAALLGMPLPSFIVATAIGIIPGTLVYTIFGRGLDRAFDSGGDVSLAGVLNPSLIAALVGLGALALLPILIKRWRSGR